MTPERRSCAICGGPFEARHPRALYCSTRCKSAANNARGREYRAARQAREREQAEAGPKLARPCACEEPIYGYDLGRYCLKCGRRAPLPAGALL